MSTRSVILAAALLALAAVAHAQADFGGPHVQLVEYRADQVVRIETAIGYQSTIELAPDELIQTVAVGDAASWAVTANKAGDRLFVKPVQAGAVTNMAVVTSARSYNFELSVGQRASAYTVRFSYPAEAPPSGVASSAVAGHYRLSGDRRLWPDGIHDDGNRTFIDWAPETPLPAVYVIDPLGRELLANGHVRDRIYVIDGVEQRLVFRIDGATAKASRYIPKKPKS